MNIQILTIFPEIFKSFLDCSLIKKALDKHILSVTLINIRDYSSPPHYCVDDTPYGGGAGMTMKPEPIYNAIIKAKKNIPDARVILMSPRGMPLTQAKAHEISRTQNIIIVCGRYEGIDERVIELAIDEEISIGDFILMGGEVPAMALIEATSRLLEGAVGNAESIAHESFTGELLLEAPQYTRPPEFMGKKVPDVLLSGNHKAISEWRSNQSLELTKARRPELLNKK